MAKFPKKRNNKHKGPQQEGDYVMRVRVPQEPEQFGFVDERLGASRMRVRCADGNTRICRIPGAMKRYLWVREGDLVIVKPWELQSEDKGDVIFKYSRNQQGALQQGGHLRQFDEFTEF